MRKKLESVLRNPHLKLISKTLVWAGFLGWLGIAEAKFLALTVFVAVTAVLYLRPWGNTLVYLSPLLVLTGLAPIALKETSILFWVLPPLLYLILALKGWLIVERRSWHLFLNLAIFYLLFFLYFRETAAAGFNWYWLAFLPAFFILLRDFFSAPVSLALTLLLVEIIWAVGLLPLGFLGAANLAFLSLLVVGRLLLDRRLSRKEAMAAAVLILAILFTANWQL